MKNASAFVLFLAALGALPFAAHAEGGSAISLGVGAYDVFGNDDNSADIRLEYRPDVHIMSENLKPWGGMEITTHATLWTGGGLLYDYQATPNVYITPSLGAGYYSSGNSDVDLGDGLMFRGQLELTYKFQSGYGVSAYLSSLTDFSDDGEDDSAEQLGLYWHVPFNRIFQTDSQ